jgi:hypothetical protein
VSNVDQSNFERHDLISAIRQRSHLLGPVESWFRKRITGPRSAVGYSAGVTGRKFCNEINGPLDKIRTITCDKRAKSLSSNQTNTSHQCLARERRKIAHQISPLPVWTGVVRFLVWAFFRHSQTEGAAGPVLAAAITLVAPQAPAAASGNTDRQFWIPMTELDFCAPQAPLPLAFLTMRTPFIVAYQRTQTYSDTVALRSGPGASALSRSGDIHSESADSPFGFVLAGALVV